MKAVKPQGLSGFLLFGVVAVSTPSINTALHFVLHFDYGSRTVCQAEVTERGGKAPSTKTVTVEIDYLVIGAKGSAAWKGGAYGNKIEAAILHRRQHGSPAIISEAHWIESLGNT